MKIQKENVFFGDRVRGSGQVRGGGGYVERGKSGQM